ncbi:MAG: SDR family oxidoreductase [Rhizobiales bacterium]|nr:SDR family oxidoreductase [Rhizobacter sp.]
MNDGALAGRTVCVVGGTSGIGWAIAARAQRAGARVVITGRDGERAQRIASDIDATHVRGMALDVLDPAAIVAFFAAIGPVDHLVTTAAQVRGGAFRTGALDDARGSFEGKFWSQFLCARQATVRSSILLCSGTLSRRAWPGTAALAAVNGAVEALGRALAVELAPVRVNVLSPGLVQGTAAYDAMPATSRDAMFEAAARRLPAGHVGIAASLAIPALSLMESDYATGVVLDIDGGGLLA